VNIVNGLPISLVNVLSIHPHDSGTVYAGALDGVFRTVDGGESWEQVPGLTTPVLSLAIDADSNTVYASGDGGVFAIPFEPRN
jgi:hypothetical protein